MFKPNAAFAPALVLSCGLLGLPVEAQVDVLTQRYDNSRSGANLNETTLKKSNVNKKSFGKLAFRNVDGNIYAQPLIVTNAGIANRQTAVNVVIVATEHNSVYAFDADDTSADPPTPDETTKALWHTGPGSPGLGNPVDSLVLSAQLGEGTGCVDLTTEIGITGTPAIKLTQTTPSKQGAIFVAAKSLAGTQYSYTLLALNLADGKPLGSGVTIEGSVSGPNGAITFDAFHQLNRPALLLDGNMLYIAFGGHCDVGDYRGWLFAYDITDPSNPKKLDAFSTTFTARTNNDADLNGRGGIWMSGYGPSAVDGSVFFTTGDGTYNVANPGSREVSDSVVKTSLIGGKIQIQDWFAPQNAQNTNNQNGFNLKLFDLDLGSAGPVPVPNSHLLIAGGKEGRWYLIDRNAMGQGTALSLHSLQVTRKPQPRDANPVGAPDMASWNIHGAPVMWSLQGQIFAYVMGEEDSLKQYKLIPDAGPAGWKFAADTPFKTSKETVGLPPANVLNNPARNIFMPGGFLTLSASGTDTATGIVWATMPFAENANRAVVRGVLRAFDAADVSKGELWDSELSGNDGLGFFAKFNPPVVANGKVYVTAFQQENIDNNTGAHSKAHGGLMPALVIYGLIAH
jgi:hypothetical protein